MQKRKIRDQADARTCLAAARASGLTRAEWCRSSICQTFEQVHGGQRKYGGTGLGLSTSRTLARRHGGELRVESSEGKGSTFILRMPRPASVQQPQRQPAA